MSEVDQKGAADAPRASRAELTFAVLFAAVLVVCSIGSGKLYPFEPPSFFVATAREYAQYYVKDPAGNALPLHEFGMGDFYAGQAGYANGARAQEAAAMRLPDTIVVFGEVRTQEEVVATVQRALRARPSPEYVVVSQHVIAPTRDNPAAVGIVERNEWRISR